MTEWNARAYHQASALQQQMAAERLAELHLHGTERVLDIGCGDGRVSAEIAAKVPRGALLGLDPSRDMIAFARQHFGTAERPNLTFEVGDVRALPYRAEFDLAVSFNALHWVHEQAVALQQLRLALKPGGRALLQFVPESEVPSIEDVLEEVRQTPTWASSFADFQRPHAHFTPDEYRTLAEQAGFQVERLVRVQRTFDYGSREAFAAFVAATFGVWVRRVPEELQAAFLTAALDQYRVVVGGVCPQPHALVFSQMTVALRVPF